MPGTVLGCWGYINCGLVLLSSCFHETYILAATFPVDCREHIKFESTKGNTDNSYGQMGAINMF